MGACFSSQHDEQHPLQDNPGKSEPSSSENTDPNVVVPAKVAVMSKDVNELRRNRGSSNLDVFTYDEMKMATKMFRPSEILGEGGFGFVYKGIIDESVRSGYTTTEVAIKELNTQGIQGDEEWLTEVNYLGYFQHPNLVKLIGYCYEEDHRLLVYEYMPGGSVEKHLFRSKLNGGSTTLTWSRRMKIALDAAKGLDFLHNGRRPVIFRDFKAPNLLLDTNFNAKISDFGLAKDGPVGATHLTTKVKGTHGYAAPEYCASGHLSSRCDVYAFGIVLLELLVGRPAVDTSLPEDEVHLIDWATPILIGNKRAAVRIVDPRMKGQYAYKTAFKVVDLIYMCTRINPRKRPPMREVVEALESIQTREPV